MSATSAAVSSRPLPPAKCLRSCLSPHRVLRASSLVEFPIRQSPYTSRSTSFSSEVSEKEGQLLRRAKSVRWEGEGEGCAVTSYHSTWSATEYDRTPLDPPSQAERTCVLPDRNARCLSTVVSTDYLGSILDKAFCAYPTEESADVDTSTSTSSVEGSETEGCDEDKEWEECMERRRMMFANMCSERDRHPEFDGYRSVSAALVDLLRGAGCGEGQSPGPSTPMEEEEGTIVHTHSVPMFSRLRESNLPEFSTPSLVSSTGSEAESGVETPARASSVEGSLVIGRKMDLSLKRVGRIEEDELETVEL